MRHKKKVTKRSKLFSIRKALRHWYVSDSSYEVKARITWMGTLVPQTLDRPFFPEINVLVGFIHGKGQKSNWSPRKLVGSWHWGSELWHSWIQRSETIVGLCSFSVSVSVPLSHTHCCLGLTPFCIQLLPRGSHRNQLQTPLDGSQSFHARGRGREKKEVVSAALSQIFEKPFTDIFVSCVFCWTANWGQRLGLTWVLYPFRWKREASLQMGPVQKRKGSCHGGKTHGWRESRLKSPTPPRSGVEKGTRKRRTACCIESTQTLFQVAK